MYHDTKDMMSQAKFYESYSRWSDEYNRFETWSEAVDRVMEMHKTYYADKMNEELRSYIDEATNAYKNKQVLGAQRALQFGGEQLLKHEMRIYNCTSSYCDRAEFFGEYFYILLCGAGAGFSVQKRHIKKLPKLAPRNKQPKTHVVEDSIEGWATAVDVLLSSYFEDGGKYPEYKARKIYFDLSQIRPKGAKISGGFKAPGPDPLRKSLDRIEHLLQGIVIREGDKSLRPIHAYDICMHIADAVLAGGVRRAATICLFSPDDGEMLNAKTGNWFVETPQRARSNNSAVIKRDEVTKEQFHEMIQSIKEFGEPGFVFVDDLDICFNPCVTGDTLVVVKDHDIMSNGRKIAEGVVYQLRMDEIVKRFENGDIMPMVRSYNETTKEFEWDFITAAALTRKNADLIQIETETGELIKCTPDHKILTNNRGWIEAKDLTTDDELISFE